MKIEASAFSSVRSFVAEYAVARWPEEQGGSPILFGGRRRGHDVRDGVMLIDAKILVRTLSSELQHWPGHDWKVFRKGHALFNPDKTAHIALVLFPDDMTCDAHDDGVTITITAWSRETAIFLISGARSASAESRPRAPDRAFSSGAAPGASSRIPMSLSTSAATTSASRASACRRAARSSWAKCRCSLARRCSSVCCTPIFLRPAPG